MTVNVPNGSRRARAPSRRPPVRNFGPSVGPIPRREIGFPANTNRPPSKPPPVSSPQRAMRVPPRMSRALGPLVAAITGLGQLQPASGPSVSITEGWPAGTRPNPSGSGWQYDGHQITWSVNAAPNPVFPSGVIKSRNGNPWQPLWLNAPQIPAGFRGEYYLEPTTLSQGATSATVRYDHSFNLLPGEVPKVGDTWVYPDEIPQLEPAPQPRPNRSPRSTPRPQYRPNRGRTAPRNGFTLDVSPSGRVRFLPRAVSGRPPRGTREDKRRSAVAGILSELISVSEIADFIDVAADAAGCSGGGRDKINCLFFEGKFFQVDLEEFAWGLIGNVIEDQLIGRTIGAMQRRGDRRGTRVTTGLS